MIEIPSIVAFFQTYGYVAVFGVLLLCGLGLPVPEDISLVSGGIISGLGYTNVYVMLAVSMFGVLLGDSIIYVLGILLRKNYLERKHPPFVDRRLYRKILVWFQRHGKITIFAARFMPGLRAPIYFTTGMSGIVPYRIFIMIDGIAALVSVPVWIFLGYYGARNIPWLKEVVTASEYGILIVFAVLAGIGVVFYFAKKLILRIRREDDSGSPQENQ